MEAFRGMHQRELARMAELDETEAAALGALGERDQWPVDQLPVQIDADVLRCLDVAGLVEAASVILVNQQKHVVGLERWALNSWNQCRLVLLQWCRASQSHIV
jgi:hypothetical protein